MRYRNAVLGAVLAVVVSATGCGSAGKHTASNEFQAEKTVLVVENNNWMDMNVYILRDGGMKSRLGSVPSLGRSKFTLSPAMLGSSGRLRIFADPVGSSVGYTSDPIVVTNGQEVRFKVENNLRMSSFAVY